MRFWRDSRALPCLDLIFFVAMSFFLRVGDALLLAAAHRMPLHRSALFLKLYSLPAIRGGNSAPASRLSSACPWQITSAQPHSR